MVPFSLIRRSKFMDKVTCDVTNINWCGLLLGQPYQYDQKAQSDVLNNTRHIA
jgi:hypothetical protein